MLLDWNLLKVLVNFVFPSQSGGAALCAAEAVPVPAALLRSLASGRVFQSGRSLTSCRDHRLFCSMNTQFAATSVFCPCSGVGDVAELHPALEIHRGEGQPSARTKQNSAWKMVSRVDSEVLVHKIFILFFSLCVMVLGSWPSIMCLS